MTEPVEVLVPLTPAQEQSLHNLGLISYVLHAIVAVGAVLPGLQASLLLLLVAVVIDLFNRAEAAGSWQASHFSWRLRSVLYAGLAYLLTTPFFLLFVFPGFIAWFFVSLWFLYRIVKGFAALQARKPVH